MRACISGIGGCRLDAPDLLAWLYRREASALDAMLLQRFVRCLGVWPPGTIVQLSNGTIRLVTSSGAQDGLGPTLLMADLQVPRNEALLVDLAEIPEVKIEKALRPRDVASELLQYLSPRHGAAFFVGPRHGAAFFVGRAA